MSRPAAQSRFAWRAVAGFAALAAATLDGLGRIASKQIGGAVKLASVASAAAFVVARPSTWRRTVRDVLARQLLFTGVDGASVAIRIGAAVGVLLIVQTALWLDSFGAGAELVAPLLRRIAVRELGPLLACLIVIGRSGTAIATELASMKVNGEIDVLESQGVDPMTYLVAPRVLSVALSTFSLAAILVAVMLGVGYLVGALVGSIRLPAYDFFAEMLRKADRVDALFFLSKTIASGWCVGAICCVRGLSVRRAATDVPRVAAATGVQALTSVFFISAVLSLIIYGRVLIFKVL